MLERSSTYTFEDIQGNGPLKWFELKSIAEADKITGLFEISPLIRLWERFRYWNCEDKFQNEGGIQCKKCLETAYAFVNKAMGEILALNSMIARIKTQAEKKESNVDLLLKLVGFLLHRVSSNWLNWKNELQTRHLSTY